MKRHFLAACVLVLATIPVAAQTTREAIAQGELNLETQALQVIAAAENAGAPTLARSLYDEAQFRIKSAQANWNSKDASIREQSRLQAEEALWAARAALAKAQWLSTNLAIQQLQNDITRYGGRADVIVRDEPANIDYGRGNTTKQRIDVAQAAIDQAKAVGAEQIAGNDLKPAQDNVGTARKINSANRSSVSADHLAFIAEMIARRAYYMARSAESARLVPGLQISRTNLAQQASAAQAAADRAARDQAERDRAALAQQLAAEQANREAQADEVTRLRQQLDESRRSADQRAETDRAARLQAEQQLDDLTRRYQAAIASGNAADVERLRGQVEDQQIALRSIQERERLNEQSMGTEIESLRTELQNSRQQGTVASDALAERQAAVERREQELQALKKEREADLANRTAVERQNQAAITDAQRQRQDAEAQAMQLKAQLEQAQQQAQQQAVASQAELDRSRQEAQNARAELDRTRQQLAQSDLEARRLRMQQNLNKVATTKTSDRGLIVTLSSGILFDSGKSTLKPGAKRTLTRIAVQLKGDDSVRIAVEGHTDNVGTSAKNQTLSEKRANAVRVFLITSGVPTEKITATGLGEKDPVATNKTATGRQANRRVELVITNG
jgi:outer membrane protein OmpA-like peptidoglycan-associated protein